MPPEVTVVLPVYRNARHLPELHRRLGAVLAGKAYALLFVVDASPDESLDVLRAIAAQDAHVTVIALARNVGQNRAVMTGLSYVRGAQVVVMDADLQDPPEAIPHLLDALDSSAVAVFAGRRGSYESRSRMLTSFLFKRLMALVTLGRVPADAGLFVALRREMVDALLAFQHPDPYVIGLMARTGLPMRSIPVQRSQNRLGESGYTFRKRWALAVRALRTMLAPVDHRAAAAAPIAEIIRHDVEVAS